MSGAPELSRNFAASVPAGASSKRRRSGPPPFSLRLSEAEKACLKAEAGAMPLGAYIRERLLGEHAEKRRKRRAVVEDYEKLAMVLAALGRSHLAQNMNQLAKAANMGTLDLTMDITAELLEACRQIREMRDTLIAALGIRESEEDRSSCAEASEDK
mgnify:CR=1 FL=1